MAVLDTVKTKIFVKKKTSPDRCCEYGWQYLRWLKTAAFVSVCMMMRQTFDDEHTVTESFENHFGWKWVNWEDLSTCTILSYFTVPSVIFLLIFPALSYLQVLVGESAVPAIHRLEQVSTEEKIGSLAENLLEALRDHPDVEKKVSWFLELLKQMLCNFRACAWAFPIWLPSLHLSLAWACWGVFSRSSRVDELPVIWREF